MALIAWNYLVFWGFFIIILPVLDEGILTAMLSFQVPHIHTWKLACSTGASKGQRPRSGGTVLKQYLSQALFFHFSHNLSRFKYTT